MRTETARYWDAIDAQRARLAAAREHAGTERDAALGELTSAWRRRTADPVSMHTPDRDLCVIAERRAELMQSLIAGVTEPMNPEQFRVWLLEQVRAMDAERLPQFRCDGVPLADQLRAIIARVQCPLWWRRQLRRAVVRKRERAGILAGEVCATRRQWYVTDDTLRRRMEASRRNRAILESTELENDQGDVFTLAELADKSVSNKAIRRGELMTRIRGCEELAEALGYVGIFTTHTCPSRFHAVLRHGAPNPRYAGIEQASPRHAQRWLCKTWAKARAKLHRLRLGVFGFRVAEPHHDGCPHWHMLLWCKPQHLETVCAVLRAYWLADDGNEPGATEHRFKVKRMEKGGASGYVAKYIAKNIDDVGAVGLEGHTDDYADDALLIDKAQGEMFETAAHRVEAWATAWGIRQFQPIGQPPVTVWRELRRVKEDGLAGATERIKRAWEAAHRHGEQRADWAQYVVAQGGVMRGRSYLLALARKREVKEGRYETREELMPVGVLDRLQEATDGRAEWVLSNRRMWKPRGQWRPEDRQAAQPRAAWTRFNNCTALGVGVDPRVRLAGVPMGRRERLRAWRDVIEDQNGGVRIIKESDHAPPDNPRQ